MNQGVARDSLHEQWPMGRLVGGILSTKFKFNFDGKENQNHACNYHLTSNLPGCNSATMLDKTVGTLCHNILESMFPGFHESPAPPSNVAQKE